jgi:hypothetical protein
MSEHLSVIQYNRIRTRDGIVPNQTLSGQSACGIRMIEPEVAMAMRGKSVVQYPYCAIPTCAECALLFDMAVTIGDALLASIRPVVWTEEEQSVRAKLRDARVEALFGFASRGGASRFKSFREYIPMLPGVGQ